MKIITITVIIILITCFYLVYYTMCMVNHRQYFKCSHFKVGLTAAKHIHALIISNLQPSNHNIMKITHPKNKYKN
jgi:ABC-type multidrug transport system permease subunit